ncbi:MAG: hypothetical protein K9L02_01025 [Acholeplasmataceae bacterium]|nr:hypothetical protein [Acholeplasmataceae bacterium]
MSKPRKKLLYLDVDRNELKKELAPKKSILEQENEMWDILSHQIHGISFSPYLEDQNPSLLSQISDQQIADRLEIVRPYTKWIRTFSCSNGNEVIPRIAHEKSLKTLVGAWISDDEASNELEINNAVAIAKAGYADILAIGNEVLLREDIEVEQLITYIRKVKEAVPNVLVGYVDAYYTFENYPEIVDEVDVVLANCYPFWEYCGLDISLDYMKEMYRFAQKAARGKKVIISETGWPTKGERYGDAIPSYENSLQYFLQVQNWVLKDNIDLFYFSSFDEVWKMNHEGEYGAFWGIWDKDGQYKFKK